MYDLIVVGGGPAGLTATIYAIRKRLNVLLVSRDLGGKTNYRLELPWIQEYQVIRGLEVVNKFKSELEYLDFSRQMGTIDKITRQGETFKLVDREGEELEARAVILATGARQQWLDVPGEREYMMRGLCYSALSYAPLFIDRTNIVIGDGDLALRSTAELATIAKHVHLVCTNGGRLDTPLGKKLQAAENVEIMQGQQVVEVLGDEFANGLRLKSPAGETMDLHADAIFVEKGLVPNTQMVAGLVEMDAQNRVVVDCAMRTNVPGIFAAGDMTSSYAEQVLIAVGDGAKAALSAYEYLLPLL